MLGNVEISASERRFRSSIVAISSAVVLFGSLQCIVLALQEPLRPAAIWLVNLSIDRGHFRFDRLAHEPAMWYLFIINLAIGIFGVCLSYGLASWNYRRRSQP